LPSILKRIINPKATSYQFPDAEGWSLEAKVPFPSDEALEQDADHTPVPDPTTLSSHKQATIDFASLQADSILAAARQEAQELLAQARQEMQAECEQIRASAHEEGFRAGYADGISHALAETQAQRARQAEQLSRDVRGFLDKASAAQEDLLEQTKVELRDLSIAVAEKIIRVSLKNSGEIISRMITRATEKLRRKEWVHIYIAGCDAKSFANISPNLTAALGALSDQVKIIPLAEEESGTCMIEMPDEIIDASVSTQLSNIRDLLSDPYVQNTEF